VSQGKDREKWYIPPYRVEDTWSAHSKGKGGEEWGRESHHGPIVNED
jgi:hypothetical protein